MIVYQIKRFGRDHRSSQAQDVLNTLSQTMKPDREVNSKIPLVLMAAAKILKTQIS